METLPELRVWCGRSRCPGSSFYLGACLTRGFDPAGVRVGGDGEMALSLCFGWGWGPVSGNGRDNGQGCVGSQMSGSVDSVIPGLQRCLEGQRGKDIRSGRSVPPDTEEVP